MEREINQTGEGWINISNISPSPLHCYWTLEAHNHFQHKQTVFTSAALGLKSYNEIVRLVLDAASAVTVVAIGTMSISLVLPRLFLRLRLRHRAHRRFFWNRSARRHLQLTSPSSGAAWAVARACAPLATERLHFLWRHSPMFQPSRTS